MKRQHFCDATRAEALKEIAEGETPVVREEELKRTLAKDKHWAAQEVNKRCASNCKTVFGKLTGIIIDPNCCAHQCGAEVVSDKTEEPTQSLSPL